MHPTPYSRRDFGLVLATGATSAAVASVPAVAKDDQPPVVTAVAPDTTKESQDIPAPVYLLGAVLKHYADQRLDEAAINGILRDITGDLARGRVLSAFPLMNSDEPGYVFRAFRAD